MKEKIPKELWEALMDMNNLLQPFEVQAAEIMHEETFVCIHHMGLARQIRNEWFYSANKKKLLSEFFCDKGISHPDDITGILFRSYHRHLKGKEIQLDAQVEKYRQFWAEQYGYRSAGN